MRVALLTEGCYPFVTGGVSTWCDQLVRGLPEHQFIAIAITGGGGEQAVWDRLRGRWMLMTSDSASSVSSGTSATPICQARAAWT